MLSSNIWRLKAQIAASKRMMGKLARTLFKNMLMREIHLYDMSERIIVLNMR